MEPNSLFRDFSFVQGTRERETKHCPLLSPTQMPTEYFARPTTPSVGEISAILDRQTLHVEANSASYHGSESHNFAAAAAHHNFSPSRLSIPSLRLQRQIRTRRHCNPSHLRDVSRLVERMVREEEQCNVLEPPSPTSTSSSGSGSDHDEGIDMHCGVYPAGPPMCTLRFRRSGDRVSKSASVPRDIRMRKRVKGADAMSSCSSSSSSSSSS